MAKAGAFGRWLRKSREDNNLTMSAVAERAGVSVALISNLENGHRQTPRPENKKKIEDAVTVLITGGVGPFGQWLKEHRIKRNITVMQLADKVGVSTQSIYNLENGKTQNPNSDTRQKIEKILGEKVPQETLKDAESGSSVEGLGALQEFDPHAPNLIPAEPGVYVLYDISERPIYVGRSANIRKRLAQHSMSFWYKRPMVQAAAYIKIANEKMRNQIEEILIRFLKSNAVINKAYVDRDLEEK